MRTAIENFATQFRYRPVVENGSLRHAYPAYCVAGMGGSALATDCVKELYPALRLSVQRNYGLPVALDRHALVIVSSYSGNTEESLSSFHEAKKRHMALVAISTGGALLALAKKEHVPFVQIPDTGIQPRMATGFLFKAQLEVMGAQNALREAGALATQLQPSTFAVRGRAIARKLKGYVPVIYSSDAHTAIARTWKIILNETGKIPAFFNVLPELNHNEMTSFDSQAGNRALMRNFHFVFLRDAHDHARIRKRMTMLERLYHRRGLRVVSVPFSGKSPMVQLFSSLVLADWVAYALANIYRLDPENVPMVEEFKKLI